MRKGAMSHSNLKIDHLSDFFDENVEEIQNLTGVSARWPLGVANGYCEGRLAVILHIWLRRGESEIEEFYAIYYRSLKVVEGGFANHGCDESEVPSHDVLHGQREQPVFIKVIEFPDERQEGRQLVVPSVVRLRSLNSCLRVTAQLREPSIPLRGKSLRLIRDWELQQTGVGRRIGTTVPDSNAVDNVIESASKVMNTITCDQSPTLKRGRFNDVNANAVAATIGVTFFGKDIRVSINPRVKFGLESIEMFLGTTYLEEAASEFRTDHAVYGIKDPVGAASYLLPNPSWMAGYRRFGHCKRARLTCGAAGLGLTAGKRESRPGLVDRADFEIDPSGRQSEGSDGRFRDVSLDSGGLLRPCDPQLAAFVQ